MPNLRPVLSICLPTNGVVEWVMPTLDSIYSQNVDYSLFEVVITDNGENSKLGDVLKAYEYPNLKYFQTKDKGFLNLVTCLQMGNGLFNKMLNHRMILKPGMLQRMIDVVNQYKDSKPVLYFLNGCLKLPEFTSCKNLNDFVYNMHFWISWSAGIGFWDIDLPKLSQIETNKMFPNTSLLVIHRLDSEYVIWNGAYGMMQDERGKGGYNIFHTFSVVFLDLIKNLEENGRITPATFNKVKKRLRTFLAMWYYNLFFINNDYTFSTDDYKKHIMTYYNWCDYFIIKYYYRVINFIRKQYNMLVK